MRISPTYETHLLLSMRHIENKLHLIQLSLFAVKELLSITQLLLRTSQFRLLNRQVRL